MLNIESAPVSPLAIYMSGIEKLALDSAQRELGKKYELRGGTSGCFIPSANGFAGVNPREGLARFMGYQLPKSRKALLIFQTGFATESQFAKNVLAAGVEFKSDMEYPISIPNWVGEYPLSGRPDGIFLKDGKPVFGVELKALVGENTAVSVFHHNKPKIEAVCQATKYSMATGLPWVIVYSNPATQGRFSTSVPVSHKEFFLSIRNDKVFSETTDGESKATIVTAEGVKAFDEAIVEAYLTKDVSFLDWLDLDVFGEQNTYDGRVYNEFSLIVNSNQTFDKWVADVEIASKSKYLITYKGGKAPSYSILNTETDEISRPYISLVAARQEYFTLNGRKS
jgi:hypothetical protein